MDKKRVAVVGAGVSGLAACKHLLERGCMPVVFEADTLLGGVWARTPDCTSLQSEQTMYRYSDFPWPESVTEVFPNQWQVIDYLNAYARHFGVLDCVRFGHRVVGMEYVGVDEGEVVAWEEWAGCGEAFGDGVGEWRLAVADDEGHVQVSNVLFSTKKTSASCLKRRALVVAHNSRF
jgi:dimethylaniline monooxygenase (N-oxide forming)